MDSVVFESCGIGKALGEERMALARKD